MMLGNSNFLKLKEKLWKQDEWVKEKKEKKNSEFSCKEKKFFKVNNKNLIFSNKREEDGDLAIDDKFLIPILFKEEKKSEIKVPDFNNYLNRNSKSTYQINQLLPNKVKKINNPKTKEKRKSHKIIYKRRYKELEMDIQDIITSNYDLIKN